MANSPTIADAPEVKTFLSARSALINDLVKEQHKGVNRIICVIREHGRKWDKEHAGDDTYVQGGFVKAIKHEFEKEDFPELLKSALKYL